MAQAESHTERAEKSSWPNSMPIEWAEMGKVRIEELACRTRAARGFMVAGMERVARRAIW